MLIRIVFHYSFSQRDFTADDFLYRSGPVRLPSSAPVMKKKVLNLSQADND